MATMHRIAKYLTVGRQTVFSGGGLGAINVQEP